MLWKFCRLSSCSPHIQGVACSSACMSSMSTWIGNCPIILLGFLWFLIVIARGSTNLSRNSSEIVNVLREIDLHQLHQLADGGQFLSIHWQFLSKLAYFHGSFASSLASQKGTLHQGSQSTCPWFLWKSQQPIQIDTIWEQLEVVVWSITDLSWCFCPAICCDVDLYIYNEKYFSERQFSYIVRVITWGHGYASWMRPVAMNEPHYKAQDWSEL